MKTTKIIYGIALALTCSLAATLKAQNIYVASGNPSSGNIGEYTTSGATINASLISDQGWPWGLAISGNDLFVANNGSATVSEYTTSGATVNAALISTYVEGIAIGPVPEPSAGALASLGAAVLWLWRRRK
jgi:MYXO-CTERM domain-containing protein